MAPQTPLFPPAAFDRSGGLPPCEPTRFSSNPTFDQGFLAAAYEGDLRLVKRAVRTVGRGAEGRRLAEKLGAVRDGYGTGLLHTAALGGSLPVCRYLVEDLLLDVNDVGPGGSCEIVELLLSKGADVDAVHFGGTALHLAARFGRDDIMKVLLDHHADHTIALGGTGYTVLVLATIMGSLKCVKVLLEAGADVDGTCKETPLMIATTHGSTAILKCLVLAGADANIPDSLGRVPIEIAARSGRREDVEVLFPVTSRIPSVRDWSVDGIMNHVKSVRPAKKAMLASAKFRAHEAFKKGDYLVAARIYAEALDLDPGNATMLCNRSLCWLRYGDAKEALKDAQALRTMRPGCPKACYREGSALMLLKDYKKACGALLDGLKLEPENVEIEDGLREALESLKVDRGSSQLDQHRYGKGVLA